MKNSLFKLLLLTAIIGISFSSFGQKIKGLVTDAKTSELLLGVQIVLKGTTIGTITGSDGSFLLDAKTSGNQTIIVSFMGYATKEVAVNLEEDLTDVGTIQLETDDIVFDEVMVIASFAKDRSTPVSVSNIKPEMIMEKMGSKEFPEILKSTPSVYATKSGGGYGDGRINLRGFESNNIGVLINGVPVNDMESGKVYWSNWAGLSDVTRTMQVQRGLGASKLAISSVGGTINIITKSTDVEKGGNVYYAVGNDNYQKMGFTLSTGLTQKGWAVTISGYRTKADGYIQSTNYDAWSYFFNVSKKINSQHQISFTGFGAPQWHNQRGTMHKIQDYRNNPAGIKYSSDYGYLNGKNYNIPYAYNVYHKPQMSLNHTWTINDKSTLSTAAYASFGRGGGRRGFGLGSNDRWIKIDNTTGRPYENTLLTPDGLIDWQAVQDSNAVSQVGSKAIVGNAVNSHDWYGVLTSYNTKINNFSITAGIDGRYYKGYHYVEITDLLGGEYFTDLDKAGNSNNLNRPAGTPLKVGDKISYNNTGVVGWGGLFFQTEYTTDAFSAFISTAASNTSYQRIEYFKEAPANEKSEWKRFYNYSGKGGVNYNITENHNVFFNAGYFTKAPFFSVAFVNNTNKINEGVKDERAISTEIGYGFRSKYVNADLTGYRTAWLDKALTRSVGTDDIANITGLNAIHYGVELFVKIEPTEKLNIQLMSSVGDWRWQNDVVADIYNKDQVYLYTDSVYAKNIHVGDAAQTTASASLNYEILPKLKVGFDYNYNGNLYAYFKIENRTSYKTSGVDAWKLPEYHLVDFNVRYGFKLGKLDATLVGNVDNLLDTEYISDATDGLDAANSLVYFGFGRTWTLSLKVKF